MLCVRISIRARRTTLCDVVCGWFSPGPPVSSTNKTDRHNITEILLKVALNTIKQTKQRRCLFSWYFIVKSCKWLIDKLWQNTILHSICQMRFVSTYTCTSQVQNVIYAAVIGLVKHWKFDNVTLIRYRYIDADFRLSNKLNFAHDTNVSCLLWYICIDVFLIFFVFILKADQRGE
jgi:hypothetical protein